MNKKQLKDILKQYNSFVAMLKNNKIKREFVKGIDYNNIKVQSNRRYSLDSFIVKSCKEDVELKEIKLVVELVENSMQSLNLIEKEIISLKFFKYLSYDEIEKEIDRKYKTILLLENRALEKMLLTIN